MKDSTVATRMEELLRRLEVVTLRLEARLGEEFPVDGEAVRKADDYIEKRSWEIRQSIERKAAEG